MELATVELPSRVELTPTGAPFGVVVPVGVADLDVVEIGYFRAAIEHMYSGTSLLDAVELINSGRWLLFAHRGSASICGVAIGQLLHHRAGSELNIIGIAGKGYIRNFDKLFALLADHARNMGCRWIAGSTPFKGLAKVYEKRLKPEITMYSFLKEINRV